MDILEQIGLTKSESKVYLSLLEIGKSSTGKIVDHAGIASSKIYEILEKLSNKGLVSYIVEKGVKHFEATDPDRIIDYVEEKEKKIKEQKEDLKNLIPELKLKQQLSKYKSEATVFRGTKGAQNAFDSLIDQMGEGDEYYAFASIPETPLIKRFFLKFHNKRAQRKITANLLYSSSQPNLAKEISKLPYTNVKFVEKELFPTSAVISWNETVLLTVGNDKDITVFKIEDKYLANSFQSQLETLWNQKVTTFKGEEEIRNLFLRLPEFGDYCAFTDGETLGDILGDSVFQEWQERKHQLRVKSRVILGTDLGHPKIKLSKDTQFKFIPGHKNPVATFIFDEFIINVILTGTPVAFKINNKEVADTQRVYFEQLWNQKVTTYKGQEEIQRLFLSLPEYGDYDGFAEGMKIVETLTEDIFVKWQNKKKKLGVKSRLIMGSRYLNEKTVTSAHAEFKFVPNYENPGVTLIFKDFVINAILTENPVAFKIENKEIADTQRTYFELLWNQDTTVQKGFDAFSEVVKSILHNVGNNGSYSVFGAGVRDSEKYSTFFKELIDERSKRNINANLLFEHSSKDFVEQNKMGYSKNSNIKYLPYSEDSPMETFIEKDKVHLVVQDADEPTIISINNESVAKSYQKQFDSFWNQKAHTYQGLKEFARIFDEFIEAGEVDMIAARGYFVEMQPDFIDDWEKRAKKKGLKIRNIVDPKTKGHRITNFDFAKTKYTLSEDYELSVISMYAGKVVISNWSEGEPIIFVIEDKSIFEMYKKQFELLWNK